MALLLSEGALEGASLAGEVIEPDRVEGMAAGHSQTV